MDMFEGTRIQKRIYGKSELAEELGLSSSSMRKFLRAVEHKFPQEGYSKFSKILFPKQIGIFLAYYGFQDTSSSKPS